MTTREQQIMVANKLQQLLGDDYVVHYDACESCMTFFYYKGVFYKRVPNDELVGSIDVFDFGAPMELKLRMSGR